MSQTNFRGSLVKSIIPRILFSLCLGLPVAAKADVSPAHQNEASSAFHALDTLARQTKARGNLPRWSNPAHAKVLERLWNVEATLGKPPYRSVDVPALLTIAERGGAVFKTYLLFAPQGETVVDTAANTFTYQDEISRAAAYMLHVFGAELEAVTDFVGTLPPEQMNDARRTGLQQMRFAITEQVTGFTLMLRSPNLKPENRVLLLDALNHNAPQLAAATSLADRAAMAAQIDAILPVLSAPERSKAQTLKSAFAGKDCEKLCATDG